MPQIIDKDTFEKVQHLLNKRSNRARLQFKPTNYLLTGLLECGKCGYSVYGATSYNRRQVMPYLRYTHKNYTRVKSHTKDIKVEALDNWIIKIVIPEMINQRDIRERVRIINAQISDEKKSLQNKIDDLNLRLSKINHLLENQAIDLVKNSFSMFALEEVAQLKDDAGKIKREIQKHERKKEIMIRITIDKFTTYIKRIKSQWESKSTHEEKILAIKSMISKIAITNEKITAYFNYDMVTKRLCDFEHRKRCFE